MQLNVFFFELNNVFVILHFLFYDSDLNFCNWRYPDRQKKIDDSKYPRISNIKIKKYQKEFLYIS